MWFLYVTLKNKPYLLDEDVLIYSKEFIDSRKIIQIILN